MNRLTKIIMACTALMVMCCLGCKATPSVNPSSSQSSEPKIKTAKKTNAKSPSDDAQVAFSSPQIKVDVVPSEKMGRSLTNLIVLPKQYADSDAKFPVVYLLNGHGGGYRDWQNHTDLTKLATQYGMIFVCPDGQNSWYYDSPVDPKFQFETYITQELRQYVDQNYRTINDAKHRAITGLSMGGHGALWLAFRHPDLYGSCGSMSGAVDLKRLHNRFDIDKRLGRYEQNPEAWETHSVLSLVPGLKNGQNIIIDDGAQDFLIRENRDLHASLDKYGIKHQYSERPGKHAWSYWIVSLKMHLDFFAHQFK